MCALRVPTDKPCDRPKVGLGRGAEDTTKAERSAARCGAASVCTDGRMINAFVDTIRKAVGAMRLAQREITDPAELHAVVDACRTVRIGATDEEGIFIVPMSFGYTWEDTAGPDADGAVRPADAPRLTLWLHSASEGRKARAFGAGGAEGAPVAIEMDIEDGLIRGTYACAYSFAYRSIMGTGRIAPVEGAAEKRAALARIVAHLAPGEAPEFSPEALERTSVWRVDVERFTGKCRKPR